jgi:predicted metal-dependent hydrolase
MTEQLFARAIEEWNRGEHYEAHETLEDFADAIEDDEHDHAIVLALIHVAASLHKLANDVGASAVPGKLSRALAELEHAPPKWRGLDLDRLKRELAALLEQIEHGQPPTYPRLFTS